MKNISQMISPAIAAAVLFLVISLVAGITGGYVATTRPLTSLEGILVQGVTIFAGIFGSFLAGQLSAKKSAKEIVKPYARSSFRRVRSIYFGLSRVADEISNFKLREDESNDNCLAIGKMQAIVEAHIATADDVLEEWNDIVPEELQELKSQFLHVKSDGSQS